ncbi:MAG: nucleoside deaminase [Deltaproteobacteria bacterium]|nr:nucleoside deaminase [Deltaproteobacteria bacterium]
MNQLMKVAIEEARKGFNRDDGGPFGAIIVRDGALIAKAHNEVLKTNDPTAHAEILAIRKACSHLESYDLSDCEIYSTSEPCPMCFSAIHWSRLKNLYFGTTRDDVAVIGFDDSLIYDILSGKAQMVQMESINVDRDSCLGLLQEWDAKPDKVLY